MNRVEEVLVRFDQHSPTEYQGLTPQATQDHGSTQTHSPCLEGFSTERRVFALGGGVQVSWLFGHIES